MTRTLPDTGLAALVEIWRAESLRHFGASNDDDCAAGSEEWCLHRESNRIYNRCADALEKWCAAQGHDIPADAKLGFIDAMSLAERGLELWKAKPHNAKWWRKIDGTPIPNDLLVNIAEEFSKCGLVYESEIAALGASKPDTSTVRGVSQTSKEPSEGQTNTQTNLCEDCPPVDYPTDKTRCTPCPRRDPQSQTSTTCQKCGSILGGEAAQVGDEVWCHPCADDSLESLQDRVSK